MANYQLLVYDTHVVITYFIKGRLHQYIIRA
jgi:hypothetical protein